MMRSKLVALIAVVACSVSLTACAAMFSSGPRDIRVTSVTDVDYKDQSQFDWVTPPPRPSLTLSRIDFTTNTDLLALAKKNDYNVTFAVGACSKDGVKDNGTGLGSVYWGQLRIYSGTKDDPGYAAAVAKGPPFTYQAYIKKTPSSGTAGALCFTLAGGSMLGGKLRSNDATLPVH
jgi:predicted small secreted protein